MQQSDTQRFIEQNYSNVKARARAALINLYVGDALSMPVHWFYNPGDIIRAFPPHGIQGMQAAPLHHPSSIMALHSTTGGGRTKKPAREETEVVGKIILKGKRQWWGLANGHYHQGMQAGENTLNACLARRLMNSVSDSADYDVNKWVQEYIDFMTADPAQHPDTYAESCHRGFFANLQSGQMPLLCGAVTHDTPSMGALVSVAPLALALLPNYSLQHIQSRCREHVWLTHPDEGLMAVVDSYVALLVALLIRDESAPCLDILEQAARVIPGTSLVKLMSNKKGDAHVVGRTYSLACYISDSWPSVCYLAAKYQDDARKAMLTNTNLGGENAHRGSVLGTIVGLTSAAYDQPLYESLAQHSHLDAEITAWMNRFYP